MRRIRIAAPVAVACALFISASPAQAGPVFDVNAVTVLAVNTSSSPTFTPDDVLMGSIELSNAALMPGAVLGPADIIAFSFMVGGLTLSSADAGMPQFRAVVSSDMAGSFDFFRLLFTTPGPAGGCGAMCITEFGRFPTARNRVNVQNVSLENGSRRLDIFGATFALQRRNVPEPAAASLLGLGVMAGLFFARRRRASH